MPKSYSIPLSKPDISESDIEAVARVLRSSRLSIGPRMEEFENAIADYVGVQHAVAVSSGTAALHLAVRALGIGEGDEVIVPSFAFVAVANAVRYERATPVFVDIEPFTLNVNPELIEKAITSRTRAIVVVHTFGCPAELSPILELARKHNLFVIEDACEAIGAEYKGKKTGAYGDVGVFAFYPNKQITTAEGAMLVTRDPDLARSFRMLRNQGRSEDLDWLDCATIGYNYRLSEMPCALGIEQLKRIEEILGSRESVAAGYARALHGVSDVSVPPMQVENRRLSWFVFVVRLAASFSREHRDEIVRRMCSKGIGCGRYFAPIHRQPAYVAYASAEAHLPVTTFVADRSIALPFFNRLTQEEIGIVCNCLSDAIASIQSTG